jgi:hypothetical protein
MAPSDRSGPQTDIDPEVVAGVVEQYPVDIVALFRSRAT